MTIICTKYLIQFIDNKICLIQCDLKLFEPCCIEFGNRYNGNKTLFIKIIPYASQKQRKRPCQQMKHPFPVYGFS